MMRLGLKHASVFLNSLNMFEFSLKCSYAFFICSCLFMHNTSFDLKSTQKIWKTCLFHNSFKSSNLGYHNPHTFIGIYFSIQMQCLISWIRVCHIHTHIKFNIKLINNILDDLIWMLGTIVQKTSFTRQDGCLTPSHLVT